MTQATDIARLKLHAAKDGPSFAEALAEYRRAMQAEKRASSREWVEACIEGLTERDESA